MTILEDFEKYRLNWPQKVTVFMGPLLFGLMTSIAHSQRAGFAVILLFLGAGLIVLRSVQEPGSGR